MTEQPSFPPSRRSRQPQLSELVADSRSERNATLHALHVLEYALSAPAPRRHRTWVHRVTVALEALAEALDEQLHDSDDSTGLLAQIALCDPSAAPRIELLRTQLRDLAIAVASLREQIEPDPERSIEPTEIRKRLASVSQRFRQLRAEEADLIFDAAGIDLDAGAGHAGSWPAEPDGAPVADN